MNETKIENMIEKAKEHDDSYIDDLTDMACSCIDYLLKKHSIRNECKEGDYGDLTELILNNTKIEDMEEVCNLTMSEEELEQRIVNAYKQIKE